MKKSSLAAALLLSLVALSVNAAQNATTIGFQGKLLDNNNNPENGSFTMKFSIYNGAGTSLWGPESQTVTVNNGVFAVQLGAVSALTPAVFASSPTYVGVTVGSDPEMTPRQELGAAPYALSAAQLVQNGSISINAGTSYSTYTTAGNLIIDNGIIASSADIQGNITASSGNFTATGGTQFSLETSSGVSVDAGTLLLDNQASLSGVSGGLLTTSATFSAAGGSVYSVTTSSGIYMQTGSLLLGPNAVAVGIAPQVQQSSGSVTTTLAANTEKLIVFSTITLTTNGKNVMIFGFVNAGEVATAGSCYQTLYRSTTAGATCTTTSTKIYAAWPGMYPDGTTENSPSLVIMALDTSGALATGTWTYCMSLKCTVAYKVGDRNLVLMEAAANSASTLSSP